VEAGERVGGLDQVVSVAAQPGASLIEENAVIRDQENSHHVGSPLEATAARYPGDRFGRISK